MTRCDEMPKRWSARRWKVPTRSAPPRLTSNMYESIVATARDERVPGTFMECLECILVGDIADVTMIEREDDDRVVAISLLSAGMRDR